VAAAVILTAENWIDGLADSKVLNEKKRNELDEVIKEKALAWSLGRAEVNEIDDINILHASMLAMKRAVEGLSIKPDHVKIDGNRCFCKEDEIEITMEAIIKGDSKVAAISAASIIAKVARDKEMVELDKQYPQYGFAKHKGYPTKAHREALKKHGAICQHRRSFKPVRDALI